MNTLKKCTKSIILLTGLAISTSVLAQVDKKTEKFQATDESLKQYEYPEWFKDAKFGIWSHWGPQAVPRQGDWYAKKMYQSNEYDRRANKFKGTPDKDYTYHLEHYGHPSKFGYKDIIPLWKAEKWNPEQLMALYKKAGAKYFVSMATHHDHFFLWDSKIHKWNSVNMGPKKDVVKLWQQAAQKEGLKFGVSEHLAASYTWFQDSHGADSTGEYAGVPYDGANPEFQDLYHAKTDPNDKAWLTTNPKFQQDWLKKINELIDNYQPDLLYSDSKLPFDNVGREMISHFYNVNLKKNNGKLEAVYNCKEDSKGRFVRDIERGAADSIQVYPWQTDTSIGDWYYRTGQKYVSSFAIIQMLVDIVSKNGNLLINIVQTPEGDIEDDMIKTLEDIGNWTNTNGEGIYGTRPWKIYGEGPTTLGNQEKGRFGGVKDVRKYSGTDIRFTTKAGNLYVFVMNTPTNNITISALGKNSKLYQKVKTISILGSAEKVNFTQADNELTISKPTDTKNESVTCFKVVFAK